ncbi:MAG: alpha-L-fucosidase, partial [Phycisphaerales bacterium]|nr:alpha-L-fucosidase [Phycisphaerales bacterium]
MRDLIARLCLAVLLVGPAGALAAPNSVMIPPDASIDDIVRAATEVRPSARQVAWQELGFTAFVHFGMNTFTDQEWGHGGEDPRQFDPVAFDADQWVRAFRSAGMRGVVLTCKHHDGFCLWPTETTTHSVRASGWRDGRGDVVADVAAACRAHGLKFGIYLSPWDRNCADFGTPRYNDVFRAQLRELLTNYGEIYDVWFDGANCPKDDPALFDWAGHARLVRELQPGACISIMGPDVRWCGNEAGRTRASEWSVVTLGTADDAPADASSDVMGAYFDTDVTKADLGGRDALRGATRLVWWPAVTNTSIRPGWFHHERDDARVKSLQELLDVYFASVGGNTQFLLNVPPDRRGLIHENDVRRLAELGDVLRATFDHAVSDDATFTGYMQAGEYRFDEPRTVSVIDLREDVVASGQRVEAFRIDTWDGRRWTEIARGTTIGARRLVRIPPTTALGFRYWIERARAKPTIASFTLHRAPRLLTPPMIARSRDGVVTIAAREPGPVRYTTDGSDPDETSAVYAAPFALVRGGVVKARSFPDADGGRDL